MDNELRKKYIRTGILIAVVTIGITITTTVIQNMRAASMGKLTTIVVPDDAAMSINGKKAAINKTIGVSPGEHSATVKRSGFKDQTQKFTIKKGGQTELRFFLEPDSEEALQWLKEHPDQAYLAESYASKDFDTQTSIAVGKQPIIKELPFIDQFYRIDYGVSEKYPNDPTALAIYIRYWNEQGKIDALEWIKFKGYDPNKLEIIYIIPSTDF